MRDDEGKMERPSKKLLERLNIYPPLTSVFGMASGGVGCMDAIKFCPFESCKLAFHGKFEGPA